MTRGEQPSKNHGQKCAKAFDLFQFHADNLHIKGGAMRTTLDLDETLVSELMKVTRAKTKTEAIHLAITDLIRRKKIERLKTLSGTIPLTYVRPTLRAAKLRRTKP